MPDASASPAATARRALACLDLTDLRETGSERDVDVLCAKALHPRGPVAAVCVWPRYVSRARVALGGAPVRVATVANFPAGGEDAGRVVDEVAEALADGAHEIDLVMPYRAFMRGDAVVARAVIEAVREVAAGCVLKVILETGSLGDAPTIGAAARLAIAAGADFLKTSTGTSAVSATPAAAETLLAEIRAAARPVGLKVSGGVRTLSDAAHYLDLADCVMGPDWATPATFRIGASGLFDTLVAATA